MNAARIWTFDGGGPGVISQLLIVNELMHQIQWTLKLNEIPRPCDYAEMMVGSELGAVAVVLLARLSLTAEQALIHITELGQSVFLEPDEADFVPLLKQEALRMAVANILRQRGLKNTTQMIEHAITSGQAYAAVTSTPTSNLSNCRLIRTYRTPSVEYNCTIVEAIQAATAVPGWFPPAKVGPTFCKESLAGGAIGYNNPTKKALEEAKRIFGPEHKASIILSLGSGRKHPQCLQSGVKDEFQQVLVDMVQSGEETARELSQRFGNSNFYHRFSVDSGLETLSITGWAEDDLGSITTHTKVYIESVWSSLSAVSDLLVKNEGCITLGQLTQVDLAPSMAKSIPRLTPFFIERRDITEFMEQKLIRDSCDTLRLFVVHGMGGSGKTQTASFFGRRNKNRYKHIFFIDASSVESIKADLQSAIRSLGGGHSQGTFEDALRFLAHLANYEWLLIFDNADNPAIPLTSYIPECDHGTVIITGRNIALAKLAPTSHWHLQSMSELDSIQVLVKAAQCKAALNKAESNAVIELSRSLGGLPLALVHAGNYCDTTKITFSEYLKRFQSYRSQLMTMEPPLQLDRYSYSTYTSIKLSYSLLAEQACSLLHLLTSFHPSSICLDILRVASKHGFEIHGDYKLLPCDNQDNDHSNALRRLLMPDETWNDIHIDSLLNQLQSFSLISLSRSNNQTSITIHPLVQSCILDTLLPEVCSLYFSMTSLVLSSCSYYEELPLFQHLSMHIVELDSRKMTIHPNHYASLTYVVYENGNYEEAMKRAGRVTDECRRLYGDGHRSTLYGSSRIAACLRLMQRSEEAEYLIRTVVKRQEIVLGEDDDDVLFSYQLLTNILRDRGETEEAAKILQRLLASSQSKYGQRDWRTLNIQSSLAANLHFQKRYSEAEVLSRSILPIMKDILGENKVITLFTLNTLSVALMGQRKWTEAEDILGELITKNSLNRGRIHPETLTYLYNLAICLLRRDNLDEAQRILEEVVQGQEKILGKNHPHTIDSLNWLEYVMSRGKHGVCSTVGL